MTITTYDILGLLLVTLLKFFILIFGMTLPLAALLTWMERRQSAYSQDRIGPSRAHFLTLKGKPFVLGGLFHVVADALKMFFKEPFVPQKATRPIFDVAPMIGFVTSLTVMAMVPFAPDLVFPTANHPLWQIVPMQMVRVDSGLLLIFAMGSLGVYGVALAGWSSGNRFAMLGGLRAAAQTISYEIALGLTLMGVLLIMGTTNLQDIVAQGAQPLWPGLPAWGIFLQPFAALLFLTAAIAETKRAPFDAPEGESEIVGYFLEYSSMGFGLFMLGEFIEVVVLSSLFTCIFLGGWQWPWLMGPEHTLWLGTFQWHVHTLLYSAIGFLVFVLKVFFVSALQLQIRWTLPRFRYDQIMHLGWKVLLPAALINFIFTLILFICDPSLNGIMQWNAIGLCLFIVLTLRGPLTSKEVLNYENH